jgi:hypothetical protein
MSRKGRGRDVDARFVLVARVLRALHRGVTQMPNWGGTYRSRLSPIACRLKHGEEDQDFGRETDEHDVSFIIFSAGMIA